VTPSTHLTDCWPDTDMSYLSRAAKVLQLQRWMRDVAGWLRGAGASVDEVIAALEGCVAWLESERHREREAAAAERHESYVRQREAAPARRAEARRKAEDSRAPRPAADPREP